MEGGAEFQTQVGGNPNVKHCGDSSVFHLVLEDSDAKRFVQMMEGIGCTVVCRQSRKQTKEQEAERASLLGVGKKDAVWPCSKCPTCYWFDPTAMQVTGEGDPCGFSGWPEDMRRVCLESTKAVDDLEACPLKRM